MSTNEKFSVLEITDVFKLVLSEWLGLKEQLQLDVALSGTKRLLLLNVLRSLPVAQPFSQDNEKEKWWKHQKDIYLWMAKRGVILTKGWWEMHEKLWDTMFNNRTPG
eukprot:gene50296-61535_t